MSFKAEKRYVDRCSGRIIIAKLYADTEPLPKRHRTWSSFKERFDGKSSYEYLFQTYKIRINLRYAFKHFIQNTYNEQRSHLNGTLYDILHNPLFVIKKYDVTTKKHSLQFYKPYKHNDEVYNMMMFQVLENDEGIYIYKTLYDVKNSLEKVLKVIKALDLNTVYFKYENE